MVNTFNNIFFIYTIYCLFNHCFVAVLDDTGQLPGPQGTEFLLDLREHELDGIVLGRIRHVKDAAEAQPLHFCSRLLALMSREIIHKECNLLITILSSELLQVCLELLDVD